MKSELKKINSTSLNFYGAKTPNISDLKNVERFVDCGIDNFYSNLISSIKAKAPNAAKSIGGVEYIPDFTIGQKACNCIKSFFLIPVDILDSVIRQFPNLGINNSKFIQNYRNSVKLENEINAFQGMQENALSYIKSIVNEGLKIPQGECNKSGACKEFCDKIKDKFNKSLNKQMGYSVASYDTKKERFATRIISGFTAAFFLGNDFYNKAIQKGKNTKEAKREQYLKQGQEIKENICEGITQFAVLACFSKMVNKSVWAPAIISTVIGLVSRIVSRKSSGMPLGKIKIPENNINNIISISDYIEKVKSGNYNSIAIKEQDKKNNKTKKPLLSIKNIFLFCIFSIICGHALRFGKNHTEIGNKIAKLFKKQQDKFNSKTIEEVVASRDKLNYLADILHQNNEFMLAKKIKRLLYENMNINEFILGSDYKITKIFGVDIKTRELYSLITAPFRFVKEVVSYPHKIVSKLEIAIKNSKLKGRGVNPPKKPELLQDPFDIKNLYNRFIDFDKKYASNPEKLKEVFGKYVKEMRILSNNNITSSSTDNSKIAVLAQTLGTLTGMWFNMNDEYNSSIRNGSTKSEAQKDARLRGINKFFRMTVQVIISGSLNSLFFKQYNNSIGKAGAIVAVSTILTDMTSRFLSGMPNKKMTKEELENYQKEHKESTLAWYYKMIDKLAS